MTSIVIKPLVWVFPDDGSAHDENCMYEVYKQGKYWNVVKGVTGGGAYVSTATTREAGMQEAQRHHERRTASFITGGDV